MNDVAAIVVLSVVFAMLLTILCVLWLSTVHGKYVQELEDTIKARNEEINELKQRCTSLVSLLPIHDQQSLGYLPYED